ncbi:MAG: hypothetical protein IT336_00100 [Thermomicrobiales bacterium]|nr:hypothetical protein [Thermomicrobiales bacterium]
MGHTELGSLPKSARWRAVARLLAAPTLDAPAVAGATIHAAERRLVELRGDPSLAYCFWLLVRLAEAARGPDFVDDAARLGIAVRADDAALALIARAADRARVELNRYPESGPFGEIASLALRRALTETVGMEGRSLFGSSLEDLERAFRRYSSPAQFATLAKRFFGDFYGRTLRFYVERELQNQIGREALPTIADANAFADALDLHARETARIVEGFAADWYDKHHWEAGGAISHEEAQRFVAHALTKLRRELLADAR